MSESNWNDPSEEAANPRRAEERSAVRRELAGRLAERGIELSGDESDEQVVRLMEAVEDFERAVALAGGDSMLNDAESAHPDDPRFVIPPRRADEAMDAYVDRVRRAAESLG